ncbi:MAG: efflux RND transporter periplasmic adaptor subunit [Candidatus Eisenbacteria bacterium]
MKGRPLIFTALVVVLAAVGAWIWFARPFGGAAVPANMPMEKVGDYRMGVMVSPDPPRPGENVATIVVKDSEGKPVRGAEIDPRFVMEAMGQMPRMESRGKVKEVSPGVYRAGYGLSMAGEWDVRVRLSPAQGPPAVGDWRLSTSVEGLAFVGGSAASGAASDAGAAGAGAAPTDLRPAGTVDGMLAPGEGEVHVDAARRQALGIRVGVAEERELATRIRAAGRVAWDETRFRDITFKFGGYVKNLAADFTGRPVRKGEVLLTLYSPELLAAQQEYIEALSAAANDPAARDLAAAAKRRLELWDIPAAQIEGIARERRTRDVLPVLAPVTGVVTEKKVVDGSPFQPGEVLFRIAPLDPIWVMASVYQVDLPLVRVGAPVTIENPYLDGGSRTGRVAFVDPTLVTDTRTGSVRIEVSNPTGALRPGMFVDVHLDVTLGKRLAVPESAVLPTGERHVVFVDLGDGRLAPREVKLGVRAGDWYHVLSGLRAGDRVVTSGNFLISSEAKLKTATEKW